MISYGYLQVYNHILRPFTMLVLTRRSIGPIIDVVTGTDVTPASEHEFLREQGPGAQYVLSVCAGSMILAKAGLLSGKRATTNKAFFRVIEVRTRLLKFLNIVSETLPLAAEIYAEGYSVGAQSQMGRRWENLDQLWSQCRFIIFILFGDLTLN